VACSAEIDQIRAIELAAHHVSGGHLAPANTGEPIEESSPPMQAEELWLSSRVSPPRRRGDTLSDAPMKGPSLMPLHLKGTLVGKSSGIDREGKTYRSLQFFLEREARGGLDLIDVVLPDDLDHTSFQVGEEFEIPIRVNAKDSRLTYRYQLSDKNQVANS
jgi:hypothetical protein